jgi:hypothetical protein
VADPASFTCAENWLGGGYELALQLGSRHAADADGKLLRALAAVWQDPNLDGCYRDGWTEPEEQPRVQPVPVDLDEPGHLYGRARLPAGTWVVCKTWVSRQSGAGGVDWLGLSIPIGALGTADERVGAFPYPEKVTSRSWREPLDQWLAAVAFEVRALVEFEVGLIGEEASAPGDPFYGEPPTERGIGYVIPTAGAARYLPTNRWDWDGR